MAEELKALTAAIQHELELARAGEGYEEKAGAEEIVAKLVAPLLADIRRVAADRDEALAQLWQRFVWEQDLRRETEASRRAWAEEAEYRCREVAFEAFGYDPGSFPPEVPTVCACVTDEQAAVIATGGFSRPVCAVHPEGGAE